MPLYDYECTNCKIEVELSTGMNEVPRCKICMEPMRRLITLGAGGIKRSDAPWIRSVNGYLNEPEYQGHIETREQARAHIEREYSDPDPNATSPTRYYLFFSRANVFVRITAPPDVAKELAVIVLPPHFYPGLIL